MVCARCKQYAAAAADGRISWQLRGDFSGGVQKGSVGIQNWA